MLSKEKIREIIIRKIEADEKPGEQIGGSGHLAHKSYRLDGFKIKELNNKQLEITYRYTVFVETEFTYLPDNPPYEYIHETTIVIDSNGKIE